MEEAVTQLGKALVVTEEEDKGVKITPGTWLGKTGIDGFYLLGRILSMKTYKFEYVRTTLMAAMNSMKGMKILEVREGKFLFKFHHKLDESCVWERSPWSFAKNLFVLNDVADDENPFMVHLN
ncbi:UNVERIFIED_CONTAM: hypothetical protein Sradi_4121400 [Sesamum radiatum]|uniref:DUF4283 domain-containing protein n=1 Tax=Sesamum radiatum TaxID=300843 RepID=A0AAW2P3N5_SESRA